MSDLSNMSVDELLDAAYEPDGYRAVGELARRAREGEAMAARLPRTADGKVLVPYDRAWLLYRTGNRLIVVDCDYDDAVRASGLHPHLTPTHWIGVYSTEQAALAAREGEGVKP